MATNTNSSRRRDRLIVGLAVVAITSGLLGAFTLTPVMAKTEPANSKIMRVERSSFADLIEAVSPAVVAISVGGKAMPNEGGMPDFRLPPGSPLEDFFKRYFDDRNFRSQEHGPAPARKYKAQGSGFVIDPKGIVVTNHHVIKGADEITVIAKDGRGYKAELKGYDEKTDLAVLQVETDRAMPYVEFGNSDSARVGDPVLAIGNPFGLGGSATSGIVSARGRDINAGPLDDFLQIDASINRGNSGGPLFDASGEVIGVNTAIFSPNGGNVGIGFAIPSSLAAGVVDQLISKGRVERGWLGVQIQALTPELAESLGLSEDTGALVASVVKDSPADKAGLKIGDVILEFNGTKVDHMRDLPRIVADTAAGTTVQLGVWRDSSTRDLSVKVGDGKTSTPVELGGTDKPAKGKLGLALAELDAQTRAHYRVGEDTNGVLVVRVAPNSPSAEKGIRQGDVIKMVGNTAVTQPEQVVAEVKKAVGKDRKSVLLLLQRNGSDRFVAVGIV